MSFLSPLPKELAVSTIDSTDRWLKLDPAIPQRVNTLIEAYKKTYQLNGNFKLAHIALAIAPGRAEILGNHTDYNEGYTISANITQNLLLIGEKRTDNVVQITSCDKDAKVHEFMIGSIEELEKQKSEAGAKDGWTNYIKGIVWSFLKAGHSVGGFNAILESTIPQAGGTSSSAALETAFARLICQLNDLYIDPETQVQLCKKAENEYVGVPCGYLDQGTVSLAEGWLIMSYRAVDGKPFTFFSVPMDLSELGYQLIVGYDPNSKHALVDGKYAVRQKICFESIPVLRSLLPDKDIQSLRDVSGADFEKIHDAFLQRKGEQATKYITHVIYEDERVLTAQKALEVKDINTFGNLLTESGDSAINLYQLDEESPELRFVYETVKNHQKEWGVAGIRNMGGGFNATTLALVASDKVDDFKKNLQDMYQSEFKSKYHFLEFVPTPPAGILDITKIV